MSFPANLERLTGPDINDLSERGLVLVIPISKSKNFPLVDRLSKLIFSQRCLINAAEVIVCVADLSSPRDCEISMEIINISNGWKGFSVIARRNILSSFSYYQVIPCMIEAFQCDNKKAHCHTRVNNASFLRTYALHPLNMVDREGLEAVLPCKLANYGFYDPMIDATLVEQYQAHAVSRGVHWCPNFDASSVKVIDNSNVEKKISDCEITMSIENKKPA